jgi:hypothetical protein
VSANLLDAQTNAPLAKPYCVVTRSDGKVAIVGVTERPAGLDILPHLRRQFAGIRIEPPVDALGQWLPKAKAESDRVILLYYGSSSGLQPIQQKFGDQLAAIVVGGFRPDNLSPAAAPPLVGAEEHGKSVARLTLSGTAPPAVEQLPVTPDLAADPAMEQMLAKYQPALATPSAPPAATESSRSIAGTAALPPTQPPPQGSPAPEKSPLSGLSRVASGASSPVPATAPIPATAPPPAAMAAPPPAAPPPVAPPTQPPDAPKRVAAHQNLTPRGLEGVGLTAEQVNSAIDRGAAFLWNYIKTEDLAKHHHKLGDDQEHVLACLALVHAGAAKKFPDFDHELRAYLARSNSQAVQETYQSGLLCMLIESYGDPTFFRAQRAAARYLVESQGPQGSWTYIVNVPPDPGGNADDGPPLRVLGAAPGSAWAGQGLSRTSDWKAGQDGDNSCSQFALLGLHSASRCNNRIAADLWRRSLETNRRRQAPDGGWGYREDDPNSYGSMTCAGLCAAAMDLYELGNPHPELDESIERGLAWMDRNFSVSDNPQKGNYLYYYLYSLERVGRILDTEFIGSHEWYPLGARKLVDSQEQDGRWLEKLTTGDDPRVPSSFALLFLTRATPKLQVEVKHGGPGTLRAEIESAPPSQLYVILDASGSMVDLMDGQQKFDVARSAVSALIDALPDTTLAALRVYGHRKSSIEPDSDEDSALEIRMGTLDRPGFAAKLKSLRARGKTPLALSLTQAMSDLRDTTAADPVTLVLLTDGGEDTMPRRDPVKAAAQLSKHPGITFHIVGFDINQEDWGRQLRAMADVSGGHYWPAARPRELSAQLIAAVFGRPDGFVVVAQDGRQVCTGRFGQPLSLPEGSYVLKTVYGESEFAVPFSIATDTTTSVMFDAAHARAQPGAARPASAPPQANPPSNSAPPRFCTHCGHALPPGAKFCPACGQPVGH